MLVPRTWCLSGANLSQHSSWQRGDAHLDPVSWAHSPWVSQPHHPALILAEDYPLEKGFPCCECKDTWVRVLNQYILPSPAQCLPNDSFTLPSLSFLPHLPNSCFTYFQLPFLKGKTILARKVQPAWFAINGSTPKNTRQDVKTETVPPATACRGLWAQDLLCWLKRKIRGSRADQHQDETFSLAQAKLEKLDVSLWTRVT